MEHNMTKQLIETTGAFELVDYSGTQTLVITNLRPVVAEQTNFVQARAAAGQIRVIESNLNDDASDEEFGKYWEEAAGDRALAIEAFKSSFEGDKKAAPAPAPRGRKPKHQVEDSTPSDQE